MRKVQFPFAARCCCCCCWGCGFRRCCCTSSKFPPPKAAAAAAAQDPKPREAAAIPSSKAKCRNWATSRSRRPTGSPCGWRALLRMQQFPGMPKSPNAAGHKMVSAWTAKISAPAPILLLARSGFFFSPLPLAQFQRAGGLTGRRGSNGLATPNPRPHALPRGTGGGSLSLSLSQGAELAPLRQARRLLSKLCCKSTPRPRHRRAGGKRARRHRCLLLQETARASAVTAAAACRNLMVH